ncbi:MAG TPA: hypothetical protein VFP14_11270, partial [Novosphingobium sp.]|nr:hypothetical protein [Novosphingobium sp.]
MPRAWRNTALILAASVLATACNETSSGPQAFATAGSDSSGSAGLVSVDPLASHDGQPDQIADPVQRPVM